MKPEHLSLQIPECDYLAAIESDKRIAEIRARIDAEKAVQAEHTQAMNVRVQAKWEDYRKLKDQIKALKYQQSLITRSIRCIQKNDYRFKRPGIQRLEAQLKTRERKVRDALVINVTWQKAAEVSTARVKRVYAQIKAGITEPRIVRPETTAPPQA